MPDEHVYPVDDWIEHLTVGHDCQCEPTVQYIDPETGLPYAGGALVLHNRVGPPEPGDNPPEPSG